MCETSNNNVLISAFLDHFKICHFSHTPSFTFFQYLSIKLTESVKLPLHQHVTTMPEWIRGSPCEEFSAATTVLCCVWCSLWVRIPLVENFTEVTQIRLTFQRMLWFGSTNYFLVYSSEGLIVCVIKLLSLFNDS